MAYSPRNMRARIRRQSASCTRVSTRYLSSKRPAIALPRDPDAEASGQPIALGPRLEARRQVAADHVRDRLAERRRCGLARVARQLLEPPAVVDERRHGVAPGQAELLEDRDRHAQRLGRTRRVLVQGEDELGAARRLAHAE